MINEYSLLWRRLVTLAASCWGRWRGPHSPHCSGVKPIGCVHKFHRIAEQNVIGSARIVCLCLMMISNQKKKMDCVICRQPVTDQSYLDCCHQLCHAHCLYEQRKAHHTVTCPHCRKAPCWVMSPSDEKIMGCVICFEPVTDQSHLECCHKTCHAHCLHAWRIAYQTHSCPHCRQGPCWVMSYINPDDRPYPIGL